MALAAERQRCAHLLRRLGLGASEHELDELSGGGVQAAVEALINYDQVDEGFAFDIETLKSVKGLLSPQAVAAWWILRLLTTRRPLQERMTLFWHGYFATSASKVTSARLMLRQNQVMRANALGSFRTLLGAVSKDPAMILWLDNQQNTKEHPNENFAREVMELYTVGLGNFTEMDVQEGARAFTGWTIQRSGVDPDADAEFVFRPVRHDEGPKEFLGIQADIDGDAALGVLCDRPETARHLVSRIWDQFVWPCPDARTVEPFVERFRANDLDIKKLLRDLMTSEEFYSPKAERSIVKSPVDICVSTLRQTGAGDAIRGTLGAPKPKAGQTMEMQQAVAFDRGGIAPAFAVNRCMRAMGLSLLYPPDAHGWENGKAWISSQTMLERVAWGDRLFGESRTGPNIHATGADLAKGKLGPEEFVGRLLSVFDAPMKPDHLPILVEAAKKASGGVVNDQNSAVTAATVSRLIFGSPEFQLC